MKLFKVFGMLLLFASLTNGVVGAQGRGPTKFRIPTMTGEDPGARVIFTGGSCERRGDSQAVCQISHTTIYHYSDDTCGVVTSADEHTFATTDNKTWVAETALEAPCGDGKERITFSGQYGSGRMTHEILFPPDRAANQLCADVYRVRVRTYSASDGFGRRLPDCKWLRRVQ